ncbi:MAG: CHAT domain-containing protein [Anaerolineales bacterium]|jgi:hypothetical protein|nr:CHAT domain-containing protein [Anaerolineales bacterium]
MIINSAPKRPTFPVITITFDEARKPNGPYQVSLSARGGSLSSHTCALKTTRLELLENDPEEYGKTLGKALFNYRVLGADYQNILSMASVKEERVHIRLDIKPDDLQQLHWERIYHSQNKRWVPLGSTATTPLSRMVTLNSITPTFPVHERPLRMLVVISFPSDLKTRFHLDPISSEERQALHRSLDALTDKGVEVTYLESETPDTPTLDNFRKVAPRNFHLLHFLCHGAVTPGGSVLYLEGADGKVDPVLSERLTGAMQVLAPKPLFCFLAACESAVRDAHDAFLPLGPALVQSGCVQAAVAMSGKVGIDTARVFAGQFYERLLYHGLVDLAVTEARSLVQEHWDWGVPVLFSRLEDNQLIDFPQTMFYEDTVALNDKAYLSVRLVKNTVIEHIQEVGMQAIDDIDGLIEELNKSHRFLNKTASEFRNLGYDQDALVKNFPTYYGKFKQMFNDQTWVHEKSSCRKIKAYTVKIIQVVGPYLEDQNRAQLIYELDQLGDSDDDMINLFSGFLRQMDDAIEQIHQQLSQNDPTGALQTKLAFDAQIDPTLRRSIDMFGKMEDSLSKAQAAR